MAASTKQDLSGEALDTKAALPTRKFKASELPLPSATRAAIDSLAHAFKKEGAYDAIRKQVWDKFKASVSYSSNILRSCWRKTRLLHYNILSEMLTRG